MLEENEFSYILSGDSLAQTWAQECLLPTKAIRIEGQIAFSGASVFFLHKILRSELTTDLIKLVTETW